MEYNKLVRDRIPELIEKQGERPIVRRLDGAEYAACLEKKLDEEVAEYHKSGEIEELADILEVVCALCEAQGRSIDELTAVYRRKRAERGGFSERIFLIAKE